MKKTFSYIVSIFLPLIALISLSAFTPTEVSAQSCGGPVPHAPANVRAVSGPAGGQVTLYWDTAAYADHYGVVYGHESGDYAYGALNIGNTESRSYTVGYLGADTSYFFKLVAFQGCTASEFSQEVRAASTGGSIQVESSQAVPVTDRSGGPTGREMLRAVSGPGVGEVTLNWVNTDGADNYHLVYGAARGQYEYGALNIGNTTSFKVSKLAPGKAYYFALVPVKGDMAAYTTGAVMGVAMAPAVEIVETSTDALIQVSEPASDFIPLPPLEDDEQSPEQNPGEPIEESPPAQEEGALPPDSYYNPNGENIPFESESYNDVSDDSYIPPHGGAE